MGRERSQLQIFSRDFHHRAQTSGANFYFNHFARFLIEDSFLNQIGLESFQSFNVGMADPVTDARSFPAFFAYFGHIFKLELH